MNKAVSRALMLQSKRMEISSCQVPYGYTGPFMRTQLVEKLCLESRRGNLETTYSCASLLSLWNWDGVQQNRACGVIILSL